MSNPTYTVSYSQWTNPYTGASTGGQAYYPTNTSQPAYRRLALPTTPLVRYPSVNYGYKEESEEEEDEESGMSRYLLCSLS